ncbi:MAG TPA: methyltransferase domain-containing protein [Gemmataceae bacterium]|nr:methyltransferase domain-containing protein [Gemmataceae bacterium]
MIGARMQASQPVTAGRTPAAGDASLEHLLEELYRQQLALDPDNRYLLEHGSRIAIANQVRTFHWYRPFLPDRGAVLDWGCNHAPDSCLLRAWFGDRLDLYSCDFLEPDRYPVFHDFARAAHKRLEEEVLLPFPTSFFDAVIGSGVLEHTAMDYESLKELHRVIKPDGCLVISYLPNWLSVKEWFQRSIRKRDFHRRLYGMSEAKQLLKRCGFYPVAARYHTFFWERLLALAGLRRWERGLSRLLARVMPVQVFASTLCFVARKVTMM